MKLSDKIAGVLVQAESMMSNATSRCSID